MEIYGYFYLLWLEVFLEIGLIVTSFTLLTSKKLFWYSGIALGIVGSVIGITGFLLH